MICSYVLPLRWSEDADRLPELTGYLWSLRRLCEVIVVDGSPDPVFEGHARAWSQLVRHCRPDPDLAYLNGKVNGVTTGVRRSSYDAVVIADDDVRYDADNLRRVVGLLERADLVVPQNYFDPAPWHARWDTGRSLLNRALGTDYPGTVAVRGAAWRRTDGYDGNVLFENLELIRTVRAGSGRVLAAPEVLVRRLPPTVGGFRAQRVRQAYDSLAQPGRLAVELLVLPTVVALTAGRRFEVLAALGAAVVVVAELGRRRAGGRQVYPADAALWAPAWLAERAVCSWLALARRAGTGGVPYSHGILREAAHSQRRLRRLHTGRVGERTVADRRTPADPRVERAHD